MPFCFHRGDHIRNRHRVGSSRRTGGDRHPPRQGPLLLCGWVWQPLQICPQDHPEYLYRVQLPTSELRSKQTVDRLTDSWDYPPALSLFLGHKKGQSLGRAWGNAFVVTILCHQCFKCFKTCLLKSCPSNSRLGSNAALFWTWGRLHILTVVHIWKIALMTGLNWAFMRSLFLFLIRTMWSSIHLFFFCHENVGVAWINV